MEINFANLCFDICEDKIFLHRVGGFAQSESCGFCEVQIAGENKKAYGVKMIRSSEGEKLIYVKFCNYFADFSVKLIRIFSKLQHISENTADLF